jgi:hypothetical protein
MPVFYEVARILFLFAAVYLLGIFLASFHAMKVRVVIKLRPSGKVVSRHAGIIRRIAWPVRDEGFLIYAHLHVPGSLPLWSFSLDQV